MNLMDIAIGWWLWIVSLVLFMPSQWLELLRGSASTPFFITGFLSLAARRRYFVTEELSSHPQFGWKHISTWDAKLNTPQLIPTDPGTCWETQPHSKKLFEGTWKYSPKQDLQSLSSSDFVFGQPGRLPGEFFQAKEVSSPPDHEHVANISNYIANLRYQPPRTPNRSSYLESGLVSPYCSDVIIHINNHRGPLAPSYKGPYQVLAKQPKYFLIDFRTHSDYVSIDRLKVAHLSFATLNQELSFMNNSIHSSDSLTPNTYALDADMPSDSNVSHHIPDLTQNYYNTPADCNTTNTSPDHQTSMPRNKSPQAGNIGQFTRSDFVDSPLRFTRRGRFVRPPARFHDYV